MEFLLLMAIAGALVWIRTRMETLERRVAELESAAGAHPDLPQREAELSRPVVPAGTAPPPPAKEGDMLAPAALPAPPAEPVHEGPLDEQASLRDRFGWRSSFDFEEIFGRLLPIWGGGIALAIAGFFLVRWSVEMGLLNEYVRVGLGFAFGTALLAAGELAFRFRDLVADERVRQALAGAGLATLYASFYFAGSHYGLIGPALAFSGLAAVTALAIALSFRFGLPSAVLGLAGGFAAPALVGSPDPNLPLLATYLALVTGGLVATGQRQSRAWLGVAALAGSLLWGALMLLAGPVDGAAVLALGGYLVLVGALLPSILGASPLGRVGRIAAAGLATVQIAALVDQSGYGLLAWGCYLLLGAAIAVLGVRFERLREAGAFAAALTICLLVAWPGPSLASFAGVASISVLVFGAVPLLHIWRGYAGPVDWGQLALYPLALIAAACIQFELPVLASRNVPLSLCAFALAALPALASWIAWPTKREEIGGGAFGALASAFALALLGGLLAVPGSAAPLVAAALAVPALALRRARPSRRTGLLQWGVALSGFALLAFTTSWPEAQALFAGATMPECLHAARWAAAILPFALLLAFEDRKAPRRIAEVLAAILFHGATTMLLPGEWIAVAIAAAVLAAAKLMPGRGALLATLLTLGTFWAAQPLFEWSVGGFAALSGQPFLVTDLPSFVHVARHVAPLALALGGAMLLNARIFARHRKVGMLSALFLVLVIAHTGFKQIFAIAGMPLFAQLGMAERTLWQALLALAAAGLASLPQKLQGQDIAARILAALALAHFTLFSLLLHNPLWAEQAVGGLPLANLLAASYGMAIALALWMRTSLAGMAARTRPALDALAMLLIVLLALSELRQLFAGTMLLDPPVGQHEDLLRSIVAIAVALGLLGWGAHADRRSWRVGSLVLMLGAVLKVFIFDAAGLEGLARIASFFALGICLIGIGWFYSRQLASRDRPADAAPATG